MYFHEYLIDLPLVNCTSHLKRNMLFVGDDFCMELEQESSSEISIPIRGTVSILTFDSR